MILGIEYDRKALYNELYSQAFLPLFLESTSLIGYTNLGLLCPAA